jgi:hypothetical protein
VAAGGAARLLRADRGRRRDPAHRS